MPYAEDEATYRRWFPLADDDNDGRVTGGDAVKFFALSGLPKPTLHRTLPSILRTLPSILLHRLHPAHTAFYPAT